MPVYVPRALKRVLLPIWNGGHRLAWRLGEIGEAVFRRRIERCDCCGRLAPMLYRRWVIAPKLEAIWGLNRRQAEALARKESLDCGFCGAKLRARRLARVLLETFPIGQPPRPARSVRQWARSPRARSLRIAEINEVEGLHDALQSLPGLSYSEYLENQLPGTISNGVRSEDLTRLTYPDASFDLVLTSETLEHVSDLNLALSEIRRVLVPGGIHLFTIPLMPGVEKTYPRMAINPDGAVTHLAPPIHHPGGDVGYPVFTDFGADFPEILAASGFSLSLHFGPLTEDDVAQVYACRRN